MRLGSSQRRANRGNDVSRRPEPALVLRHTTVAGEKGSHDVRGAAQVLVVRHVTPAAFKLVGDALHERDAALVGPIPE